jgi:hypothetical protein
MGNAAYMHCDKNLSERSKIGLSSTKTYGTTGSIDLEPRSKKRTKKIAKTNREINANEQ